MCTVWELSRQFLKDYSVSSGTRFLNCLAVQSLHSPCYLYGGGHVVKPLTPQRLQVLDWKDYDADTICRRVTSKVQPAASCCSTTPPSTHRRRCPLSSPASSTTATPSSPSPSSSSPRPAPSTTPADSHKLCKPEIRLFIHFLPRLVFFYVTTYPACASSADGCRGMAAALCWRGERMVLRVEQSKKANITY